MYNMYIYIKIMNLFETFHYQKSYSFIYLRAPKAGAMGVKGEIKPVGKSNLTLSIDKTMISSLKNDAEIQGLSVNAKVNSILSKYMLFYKHTEEQKAVTVPSKVYASMLEEFDDEKAQKLVHDMVSARIPSVFIQNNIPFTLDNLIKYSFQSISQWSGVYNHFNFYKNANDDLSLIFEHNFGERWSKVLGISFSNLINTMLGLSARYKAMPNMVSINVKTK